MNKTKQQSGFTLIEMMIVVAVIAVVASIAIPNVLRSRLSANEVNAIAALRALSEAQTTFRETSGLIRFATLAELSTAVPPYIDTALAAGTLNGYTLSISEAPTVDTWGAVAVPNSPGNSGVRGFYINEQGQIHVTTDGSAPTSADPPLQ